MTYRRELDAKPLRDLIEREYPYIRIRSGSYPEKRYSDVEAVAHLSGLHIRTIERVLNEDKLVTLNVADRVCRGLSTHLALIYGDDYMDL